MMTMTWEQNKRYIAESWLSNEREEEFKKSFMKALLEQWQHHGNGFDADMVDGYHFYDIENFIESRLAGLMGEFNIGLTEFRKDEKNLIKVYHIGLDGVKLYAESSDEVPEQDKLLPWERNTATKDELRNETDNVSLSSILLQLYELTYFGEDGLSNKDTFDTYRDKFNAYDEMLKEWHSKYNTSTKLLNSDSVNGLRFFIYTQEQYDDLKAKAKIYEKAEAEDYTNYKNDYNKLNSIRNVFIIKSEEEIKREFPDGWYSGNPDTVPFDRYYKFRVAKNDEGIKCLQYQYQHSNSEYWYDICPISEFLDEETIEGHLIKILRDNTNYELNYKAVLSALKNIPIDEINSESNNISITKWVKQNFIKGAKYTEKKLTFTNGVLTVSNGVSTAVPVTQTNGFDYLDLTNFMASVATKVKDVYDKAKGLIDNLEARVSALAQRVGAVEADLNRIKNGSNLTMSDVERALNQLYNTTHTLNYNNWTEYNESWGAYNSSIGLTSPVSSDNLFVMGHDPDNKKNTGHLWVNEFLGLGIIKIRWELTKDKSIDPTTKKHDWVNIKHATVPKPYQPIWQVEIPTDNIHCKIRLTDNDSDPEKVSPAKLQIKYKDLGATGTNPVTINAWGIYRFHQTKADLAPIDFTAGPEPELPGD